MKREKVDVLKEKIFKLWARTKKDLDRALEETTSLIKKGEQHLREISEKSKERLELMSLKLKRENLYYKLGKTVASTSKSKWLENKRIEKLVNEIRKINREIRKKRK